MFNNFIIKLVRYFSVIQIILSFQVISLVYDSSEPPLEYQLLSLINSGVCVIIFIWLLANCSEEKCKEFLMAQKGMTSYSRGRALNMLNLWNRMTVKGSKAFDLAEAKRLDNLIKNEKNTTLNTMKK